MNEPNESFTVTLASATGATVASPAGQTITITDDDLAPITVADAPKNNTTVKTPFTVSGWAIDETAPSGTGVASVMVMASPISGGASFVVGYPTYGLPSSDGAAYGSRFANSGFTLSAHLTPGTYNLSIFAQSTVTGNWNSTVVNSVTVAPEQPNGLVEAPTANAVLPQPLVVRGWALDQGTSTGTGVNRVQILAYPNPGSGQPPITVGDATYGIARPDVAAFASAQFTNSGFEREVRGLTPGVYQLVASARSTVTGTEFWVPNPVTVTVQANPRMWVDNPTPNSSQNQRFTINGWAVDLAAASGTGVNTLHVWAYPTSGDPVFLGVPTYGGARSDIAALYGAQFANSGFSLSLSQNLLPRAADS